MTPPLAPTPLELPPLSTAFRREFQKLFGRLKASGLEVKDKVDRRVTAGELTYRDVWLVLADAADAAEKASRACNAVGKPPKDGCLRPQAPDCCVPNTAEHPLRAQLAFQRETLPEQAQAGRWPLDPDHQQAFGDWFAERAADFPYDEPDAGPTETAAATEDSELAIKMATLERKLEEKLGTMRQILEVITSGMEESEDDGHAAKRHRAEC